MHLNYEAVLNKKNTLLTTYIKKQLFEMGLKGFLEINANNEQILDYLHTIKNSEIDKSGTKVLNFLYDLESFLKSQSIEYHMIALERIEDIINNISEYEQLAQFQFILDYKSIISELQLIVGNYINIYSQLYNEAIRKFYPLEFKFYLAYFSMDQIEEKVKEYLISNLSKHEKKIGILTIEREINRIKKDDSELIFYNQEFNDLLTGNVQWTPDIKATNVINLNELEILVNNSLSYLDLKLNVNCSKRQLHAFLISSFKETITVENLEGFIEDNFTFKGITNRVDVDYEIKLLTNFNGMKLIEYLDY